MGLGHIWKVSRQMPITTVDISFHPIGEISTPELCQLIDAASAQVKFYTDIVENAARILHSRYQDEELNRHLDGGFALNGEAQ